jgi:hypothetical protein
MPYPVNKSTSKRKSKQGHEVDTKEIKKEGIDETRKAKEG